MAKEKPEKKEKKEKKAKRSETEGVTKVKKEKKGKSKDITKALLKELENQKPSSVAVDTASAVAVADVNGLTSKKDEDEPKRTIVPFDALVPFANPLADEKQTKKILKSVKKAAKNKTLKRGVKEVVKAVRKSTTPNPASSDTSHSTNIVILAADISPMDVISHLPVLCEDHNIPYVYVTSRADLGAAGQTKRPTSVVMVTKERRYKPNTKPPAKSEEEKEFEGTYEELMKLVQKAGRSVRI